MTTLTISAKGQVTLEKDVLAHLGVQPGQTIEVTKQPGGRIDVRAAEPPGDITRLFGALKREGQPTLTIEEINEAIAAGWAGER